MHACTAALCCFPTHQIVGSGAAKPQPTQTPTPRPPQNPSTSSVTTAAPQNVLPSTTSLTDHECNPPPTTLAPTGIVASALRNAGQTCICANRVFVHTAVYDKLAGGWLPDGGF